MVVSWLFINKNWFSYLSHRNRWDEWVSIDQLRKFNDENKELARALRDSKNPPKSKAATPIGTSAKRKIGASDAIGSDDAGPPKKRSKESKELEGIEKVMLLLHSKTPSSPLI